MLDFTLEFEFRAMTPDADAGLIVRTWISDRDWPERGYRVRLPFREGDTSPLLSAVKAPLATVSEGALPLRPAGDWQKLRVVGLDQRLLLTVNGVPAGEYEVERVGGFLCFQNRRGTVALRNVIIQEGPWPPPAAAADIVRMEEFEKAGGEAPRPIREVRPAYTARAMRQKVEGVVEMEAVLSEAGTVESVTLTRSLHEDLDRAAVTALKSWTFRPALRDGKPVPVIVAVEMTFVLRGRD